MTDAELKAIEERALRAQPGQACPSPWPIVADVGALCARVHVLEEVRAALNNALDQNRPMLIELADQRDAAIARAEAAERERDALKQEASAVISDYAFVEERAQRAEQQLDEARAKLAEVEHIVCRPTR